jgi:hypothetical protein
MPALPLLVRMTARLAPRQRTRPATARTETVESYLWARATAADGRSAQTWARTGEGYGYTARSAVLAVEATLHAEPLGATTVTRAFGSDLSFAAGSELLAAA